MDGNLLTTHGNARIVFCADPFDPTMPDPAYQAELSATSEIGISSDLIQYEALVDELDADRAVRRVRAADEPMLGVYRGWMLRPERYDALYSALAQRGLHLLNDSAAYARAHYLPNWYPLLAERTPRSVWLRTEGDVPAAELAELLHDFNGGPVIVKDFVKSQKHRWAEACFIPNSSDLDAVQRVVSRFVELQGPDLNEGLVFRQFEEFQPLTDHSRSGMPLTYEYRIFFLDRDPILTSAYWEEGECTGPEPTLDLFQSVAAHVQSRFFTMDVALRRDGTWRIVELGDGQVAGLPDRADPSAFYTALRQKLSEDYP
jgi:hypothetical protein